MQKGDGFVQRARVRAREGRRRTTVNDRRRLRQRRRPPHQCVCPFLNFILVAKASFFFFVRNRAAAARFVYRAPSPLLPSSPLRQRRQALCASRERRYKNAHSLLSKALRLPVVVAAAARFLRSSSCSREIWLELRLYTRNFRVRRSIRTTTTNYVVLRGRSTWRSQVASFDTALSEPRNLVSKLFRQKFKFAHCCICIFF